MERLFQFARTNRRDPGVEDWFEKRPPELGMIAKRWFEVFRACGSDVRELLHDGHPTACVLDTAFGYVNAFTSHVNVGFFHGAELTDRAGLLEGSGKFMRHVKLRPDADIREDALVELIESAYNDIKIRMNVDAGLSQ